MSKSFKILLIVFVVVALICGIIYFGVSNNDSNTKTETTENTKSNLKSKIPAGISIKDEDITVIEGNINAIFTVVNKNKKQVSLKEVNVIVQDKKNNIVGNFVVPINTTLKKGEEIELMSQDAALDSGMPEKTVYIFETK